MRESGALWGGFWRREIGIGAALRQQMGGGFQLFASFGCPAGSPGRLKPGKLERKAQYGDDYETLSCATDPQLLQVIITGCGSPNWSFFQVVEKSFESDGSAQEAPQFDPFSKTVTNSVALQLGQVNRCDVLSMVPNAISLW